MDFSDVIKSGPQGANFSALMGSPHAVLVLMMAMLIVLARTGRRDKDAPHEKWLVWAFVAVLLREIFIVLAPLFAGPFGPRPGRPLMGPPPPSAVFSFWSEHLVTVILVAAFLRYLTRLGQPARNFLLAGAALVSAATAIGVLAAPMLPVRLPFLVSLAGGVTMVAALVLTRRHVPARGQLVLSMGIGVFLFRDLIGIVGSLLAGGPGLGRPGIAAAGIAGVLPFGYLFIRERSIAVHTDLEVLESLVEERTQELRTALQRLSGVNAVLLEQTTMDSLTGVRNRRGFDEALREEWSRAGRTGHPLTVALIDIDRFKTINDRFGHLVGDQCLVSTAAALQHAARRPGDAVARYGGDEFAVLVTGAEPTSVRQMLDGVRAEIAGLDGCSDNPDLSFTVSIGVSTARFGEVDSPGDLVKLADEALYRAKAKGRNSVESVAVNRLEARLG